MRGAFHGQYEPVLPLHQLRVPHPTKHDKGCALCMAKNHRLREIPNGFFNMVDGADKRTGDHFEDFAKFVLEHPLEYPETQHQVRGATRSAWPGFREHAGHARHRPQKSRQCRAVCFSGSLQACDLLHGRIVSRGEAVDFDLTQTSLPGLDACWHHAREGKELGPFPARTGLGSPFRPGPAIFGLSSAVRASGARRNRRPWFRHPQGSPSR